MIKYLNDRGVVRLTGTIAQEPVARLIESMEHLRRDCFCDRITDRDLLAGRRHRG